MTKQIDIPTGKLLLAELQEFGTFSAEAQRYIRRSLDIAFGRGDPLARWARDDEEATHILAQMQVPLDHDSALSTMVLRGMIREIMEVANSLTTQRRIRHGRLTLIPARIEEHSHRHGRSSQRHQHIAT